MGESKAEQVDRLLREGLDHYGVDETSQAIMCWEKALELDPQNTAALDYVRSADRRITPRPPKPGKQAAAVAGLLQDARDLVQQGGPGAALELLRSDVASELGSLEVEAMIELARARLFRLDCERFGDMQTVVLQRATGASIDGYDLPPDAGFLLSVVDGSTCVADLMSVSGMDSFEALRSLCNLLDAGILEIR